jgi:hypothetical protein
MCLFKTEVGFSQVLHPGRKFLTQDVIAYPGMKFHTRNTAFCNRLNVIGCFILT